MVTSSSRSPVPSSIRAVMVKMMLGDGVSLDVSTVTT